MPLIIKKSLKTQNRASKCGCTSYESDQFQATGGNFAKIFDVQNKRFITVTCSNCGYTELYKKPEDSTMDIIDFLIGK